MDLQSSQSRVERKRSNHILLPLLNNGSFKVNTGFLNLSIIHILGQIILNCKELSYVF